MEKDLADHSANDTTRATASLPGLEIELVHRKPRDAEVEAFSSNLQAMPSFEAFEHFLEAANPFAFWAQALQMAWRPWLEASRALTLPWTVAAGTLNPPKPRSGRND
jgi:hypothetical protein